MEITKISPATINKEFIPGSTIICELKIKGTKRPIKIDVDLHIYVKNPLHRNMTDVMTSGKQSIYTSLCDSIHIIKMIVPTFREGIKSYIYISIDPNEDPYTKIFILSLKIEDIFNYEKRKKEEAKKIKEKIERLRDGKLDIVCQGLMLGDSGFAKAMRNITLGLDKIGCNIKAIPLDIDNTNFFTTEKGKKIKKLINKDIDPSFWITMNNPMGVDKHDCYSIGYVMFETENFPIKYVQHLNQLDEIWTPSTFCRDSMIKSGLDEDKVVVMPLGVDTEQFDPEKVDLMVCPKLIEGKYKFLAVCGYSERKGISILVRAFAEEFSGDNNVVLYIKGGWYLKDKAQKEINFIIKDIQNPPYIHLDFNIYPDETLAKIYKMADAFVLPTRGEGWCVMPDTPILTLDRGVQEIKHIKIGDKILTHKGRFMRVSRVMKREYKGDMIKLIPSKLRIPVILTPEHRVLAAQLCKTKYKIGWIRADDLNKGDLIVYPKTEDKDIGIKKIRILDYIDDFLNNDSKKSSRLPAEIYLTGDLMRLFGYFISEVDVSIDKDRQIEFSKDIEKIMKDIFNLDREHVFKEENIHIVRYSNRILGNLFKNMFCPDEYRIRKGKKANIVRIPSEFLTLSREKLAELIKGIWRGGKGTKGTKGYTIETTSETLANQLVYIFSKFDILPSIGIKKKTILEKMFT